MKRAFLGFSAAAAAFAMAPAANAAVFGPEALELAFGAGGTISATFGRSGILAGETFDEYRFTIPQSGLASGSVTTNTNFGFTNTDLDILSIVFNGVTTLNNNVNTGGEAVFVNNVAITGGVENVLRINFIARGNGSYGGNGTFTPTAPIPEPATWGMMILGFLGMGYAMRRRNTQARVRFV